MQQNLILKLLFKETGNYHCERTDTFTSAVEGRTAQIHCYKLVKHHQS